VRRRPAALACIALGCGAVGLALATTGPAATGCTTRQCDQSSYDFVSGHMLDENTYVTNDMDSDWMLFPGNSTINIWFPPQVLGRVPLVPVVEVGLDPTPNGGDEFVPGDNYTFGAGQLALLNSLNTGNTHPPGADGGPQAWVVDGGHYGGGISVGNSTCANYFARVEVQFVPLDAGTPTDPVNDGGSLDSGANAITGAVPDAATEGALADAGLADAGADGD
jgi:hypothetical protein